MAENTNPISFKVTATERATLEAHAERGKYDSINLFAKYLALKAAAEKHAHAEQSHLAIIESLNAVIAELRAEIAAMKNKPMNGLGSKITIEKTNEQLLEEKLHAQDVEKKLAKLKKAKVRLKELEAERDKLQADYEALQAEHTKTSSLQGWVKKLAPAAINYADQKYKPQFEGLMSKLSGVPVTPPQATIQQQSEHEKHLQEIGTQVVSWFPDETARNKFYQIAAMIASEPEIFEAILTQLFKAQPQDQPQENEQR